jgi:hypothetical protein
MSPIMRENEFKKLIEREKHKADVQLYFSSQIDVLIDIVNYGTWLIARAYGSSQKKLEDVIVIGVLLKQVVSMIDAVEVLVSNGAVYPAFLQARAAFEASLYIDWILKGEADRKGKYYYVSSLRNERLWALRIIQGTPEYHEFTAEIEDLAHYANLRSSQIQSVAKNRLSEIDRILNQTSYKLINNELETLSNKRKREVFWYQPFLKSASLKRIAKDVGRSGEYVYFYERGSKTAHAATYRNHVQFSKKGALSFEPIRNLSKIDTLLKFAMGTVIHTYKSVVIKYRQGELQKLVQKYRKDWRQSFLNIPAVQYTSSEGD